VAIAAWLKQHKIQYRRQWTKHDCIINSKPARFDFYLPRYGVLVEYDGEQHYKPVKQWAGRHGSPQKHFEAIRRADRKKNAWARKRQYTLARISCRRSLHGELRKLKRLIRGKEMDEFITLHEV
jgi:very-short-patch-repair endonuclease